MVDIDIHYECPWCGCDGHTFIDKNMYGLIPWNHPYKTVRKACSDCRSIYFVKFNRVYVYEYLKGTSMPVTREEVCAEVSRFRPINYVLLYYYHTCKRIPRHHTRYLEGQNNDERAKALMYLVRNGFAILTGGYEACIRGELTDDAHRDVLEEIRNMECRKTPK